MKTPTRPDLDALGLARLFGKQAGAAKQPKKAAAGFDSELRAQARPAPAAPEASPGEERPAKKSARAPNGLESLLLSHAASPRPAPFIDTKKETVKVSAQATSQAVSQRAKAHPHLHLPEKHEAHATRTPAPVAAAERKPRAANDAREEKKSEEQFKLAEPRSREPANAPPAAQPEKAPFVVSPAPELAAPLAPVAPLMLDDASVRAVLLPTVARVSLDAGDAGRLNVQLKVNDGVTEIRATGPAAQLLEARQGELRVALAQEGLALGHFDLTQSDSQRHPGADAREDLAAAPRARQSHTASPTTGSVVTDDGRLHVKA